MRLRQHSMFALVLLTACTRQPPAATPASYERQCFPTAEALVEHITHAIGDAPPAVGEVVAQVHCANDIETDYVQVVRDLEVPTAELNAACFDRFGQVFLDGAANLWILQETRLTVVDDDNAELDTTNANGHERTWRLVLVEGCWFISGSTWVPTDTAEIRAPDARAESLRFATSRATCVREFRDRIVAGEFHTLEEAVAAYNAL